MKPNALHIASAAFESARQLKTATAAPKLQRVHGHSFLASVMGVPTGSEYLGGELEGLQCAWSSVVERLNYRALQDVIDHPSDEGIARWLATRASCVDTPRVGVQSTREQGCWTDEQCRVTVWRRFRFQAAHRLPNVPAGHKCGNLHGHSFAVVLHGAGVKTDASDPHGYATLEDAWSGICGSLDHAYLNDIPGLENPTSEHLAAWLWHGLISRCPWLIGVSVYETESCGAHFDGSRHQIWKDFTLDSAVQFPDAPMASVRRRLHGYTYTLRLHLSADLDRVFGWARDFGDVKAVFNPTFARLDHKPLHELSGLSNCGVESLARWIWGEAGEGLPELCALDLYESRGNGVVLAMPGHPLRLPL